MTEDMFNQLLDRHGPDLAAWPDTERAAAFALIGGSPRALDALETSLLVEDALRTPLPPASEALRRAVLDIPLLHPLPARPDTVWTRLRHILSGAGTVWTAGTAGAFATLLFGFLLGAQGLITPPELGDTSATAEWEVVAALDTLSELEELP